ncbi:MAG: hypothetical protein HY785_11450 [Oscillatoriophycideae cyanobacterium NC_groundwater_1537_Pr4_S-0.65um_50_18]|nr:hypothetical protein [Oscillatoriophycideae cyanobacterium NC_groundwater_1537_Pr4_S-0.65um_50_18]
MIQPENSNSLHLAEAQQPLLKGALFTGAQQVLQIIFAVRIPGGLTPP